MAVARLSARLGEVPDQGGNAMELSVQDVMTPNSCAVSPEASLTDVAQIMRECDIGDIIVLVGGWLFGILTDRDIVVRALARGLEPETTKVGEICSREPTTVGPTASVSHAARLMQDNAIRRLPVVDGAGHVMGVVSISDVALEREGSAALGDISGAAAAG
jgi:CBS domain-containing protein